eukprot:scaffold26860_cov37-Tisochrysis_lutea.AAC.1
MSASTLLVLLSTARLLPHDGARSVRREAGSETMRKVTHLQAVDTRSALVLQAAQPTLALPSALPPSLSALPRLPFPPPLSHLRFAEVRASSTLGGGWMTMRPTW